MKGRKEGRKDQMKGRKEGMMDQMKGRKELKEGRKVRRSLDG